MLNTMVSFVILLIARTARIACADRQTHTHTYIQDNYCNPRCACAPRVNEKWNRKGKLNGACDASKVKETLAAVSE